LPVIRKRIHVSGAGESGVADEAISGVICGNRSFPVKTATILREQHEAGVRAIVNALRPGVTEAETHVMTNAFVEVDQQAVPLRIPFRTAVKVNPERRSSE